MVGAGLVPHALHVGTHAHYLLWQHYRQGLLHHRAGEIADNWDIVNIRDRNGKSTWPEKNTEEHIDRTLSKISTLSQQHEYFNNPISEGEIFKEVVYGKVPPLSKFRALVIYGDPAPGESKGKKGVSFKAIGCQMFHFNE